MGKREGRRREKINKKRFILNAFRALSSIFQRIFASLPFFFLPLFISYFLSLSFSHTFFLFPSFPSYVLFFFFLSPSSSVFFSFFLIPSPLFLSLSLSPSELFLTAAIMFAAATHVVLAVEFPAWEYKRTLEGEERERRGEGEGGRGRKGRGRKREEEGGKGEEGREKGGKK